MDALHGVLFLLCAILFVGGLVLAHMLDKMTADMKSERDAKAHWWDTSGKHARTISEFKENQRRALLLLNGRIRTQRGRPSRARDLKAMQDAVALLNEKQS